MPLRAPPPLHTDSSCLQPICDLSIEHACDAIEGGNSAVAATSTAAAGCAGSKAAALACPPEPPQLAAGYLVIEDLAADGCGFADEASSAAAEHVGQLMAAPVTVTGSAPALSAAMQQQQQQQQQQPAEAEAGSTPASRPAAARALRRLRGEGSRRLSETSSLCLERLTALARSLSSWRQTQRPSSDGIVWPEGAAPAALLLRRQALRMAADLGALGEAFALALEGTGVR